MDKRIVIKKVKGSHNKGHCYFMQCLICYNEFKIYGTQYKQGRGKYCSKKCKSLSQIGIPKSESTKLKISISRKGYPKSPTAYCFPKGKLNNNYGKNMSGSNSPTWKGGKYISTQGYRLVSSPNHPFCWKDKYYPEHRLVCEKILNRYLNPIEIPHHIDGDTQNNNPENLYLFESNGKHLAYHNRKNKPILISNLN